MCLGRPTQVKDVTSSSSSSGIGSRQNMQLDYTKMKSVAEDKGLVIVDVAMDGDCALHAVVKQLQQQGIQSYDVMTLRQLATWYLEEHSKMINLSMLNKLYGGDIRAYLRQQAVRGTLCDDTMIHAVAAVIETNICVYDDDDGSITKFEPSCMTGRGKLINIGKIAEMHYVSLEERIAPSSTDSSKPNGFLITPGASAAPSDRSKPRERDEGREDNKEAVMRYSCSKLKSEAEKRRLHVVDVSQSGDSALHAVIHQLGLQDIKLYDVTTLRKRAIDYLRSYSYLIDKNISETQSYLSAQSVSGTSCDEIMLRAVSEVITKEIHVLHKDGHFKKFGLQTSQTKPVIIGVYAEDHYVSLEPLESKQQHKTANRVDTEPRQESGQFVSQVKQSQFQNEAAMQHASSSAADAGTGTPVAAAATDTCAICMDVIKDAKTLPCTHVFCSECIDQSLAYQPKCPCCGKIFGVLKGDQPEGGTMHVRRGRWLHLEGYPGCGRIVIDYYIPDGRQKVRYSSSCKLYV